MLVSAFGTNVLANATETGVEEATHDTVIVEINGVEQVLYPMSDEELAEPKSMQNEGDIARHWITAGTRFEVVGMYHTTRDVFTNIYAYN